jgi:hypothetical protein
MTTRKTILAPASGAEMPAPTIAEAARLIARGKVSAVELTEALLRRIDAFDGQLSTFVTRTADLALSQARQVHREIARRCYRARRAEAAQANPAAVVRGGALCPRDGAAPAGARPGGRADEHVRVSWVADQPRQWPCPRCEAKSGS